MIAVRVRVDDRRDRLGRQFLDLVEDRLAPAGILGVHDDHAVRGDVDGGIAATALEHEQVVFDLLDLDDLGALLLRRLVRSHRQRERADRDENAERDASSHKFTSVHLELVVFSSS